MTDIEIPKVWSPWIPDEGERLLRRPLSDQERTLLEARRDELVPTLAGYWKGIETDEVALALGDMYGGYPIMRANLEEAAARIDAVMRRLEEYPPWAIQRACESISTNGVWRKGKYEKEYPPTDAEIIDAVRQAVRLYADVHGNCVKMLAAQVDPNP